MSTEHTYTVNVTWTGNRGTGTSEYRAYERDHEVAVEGCPVILGSADHAFRGDPTRWNPEQLVVSYVDRPVGSMTQTAEGGHFTGVELRPHVEVSAAEMVDKAVALHADAHRSCFIASSVNFPVTHDVVVRQAP